MRKFHPGMGQAVAERTYLRRKGNGKWETWGDVADRVALGNSLLCKTEEEQKEEYEVLKRHIENATLLMSGRHLQHGDENQPNATMELFTNCASSSTSFASFMLLMSGAGCGRSYDDDMMLVNWDNAPTLRCVIDENHPNFNYSAHESVRDAKHKYGSGKDILWWEVEDTREGWAQALEVWENAAFEKIHKDKLLILDFSKIRAEGTPIKGMQGRPASGPVPLMNAFMKSATLKGAGLEPWLQSMYVDHYFADCVLVGGSRRSSRMSTKTWRDKSVLDFITIKRPIEFNNKSVEEIIEYRKTSNPLVFLWSSNNSITVDAEFWKLVDLKKKDEGYNDDLAKHARKVLELATKASYADGTGEPGFINQDKLVQNNEGIDIFTKGEYVGSKKYHVRDDTHVYLGRLAKRARKKKYYMITNPCLSGETLVMTADGRTAVSIKQLAEEGKDVPVYTMADDGKVTVRWMRNPRLTGENLPVYKVTFDDGTEIKTTKNHQWKLKNGEIVETSQLKIGDALNVMNIKKENISSNKKALYKFIYSNGKWSSRAAEHRLFIEFIENIDFFSLRKNGDKYVVHHKDYNSLNNSWDNLQLMTQTEHNNLHSKDMIGDNNPMRDRWWNKLSDEEKEAYRSKMSSIVSGEGNGKYSDFTNEQVTEEATVLAKELGRCFSSDEWQCFAKTKGLPMSFSNFRKENGIKSPSDLANIIADKLGYAKPPTGKGKAVQFFDNIDKWSVALKSDYIKVRHEGDFYPIVTKACEYCNGEFEKPWGLREVSFCSKSCAQKKLWERESYRKEALTRNIETQNRPDLREKATIRSKELWSDEEYKEKCYKNMMLSHDKKRENYREIHLNIFNDLKVQFGKIPTITEWKAECKNRGVSSEIGRKSSPFINYSSLKEEAALVNHRVISVEYVGNEDVYNGTVDDFHNFYVTSPKDSNIQDVDVISAVNTRNCGEIPLSMLSGGFCVIADTVPYFAKTIEEAEEAFRAGTRALIRVNTMDSIYKKEVDRTNRIGIGITGIHEFAWKFFKYGFRDLIDEEKSRDFWLTLSRFARAVADEAREYSEKYNMVFPHTLRTAKPSGTISKLFGLTEGVHLPSMAWYLRWVQFRTADPLVEKYKANGYPCKELKQYQNTVIVGFPTSLVISELGMGDKMVTAPEATMEEQYKWLMLLEKYWIVGTDEEGVPLKEDRGNNLSYTMKYDPRRVSYAEFKEIILKNQRLIKCCSVMPTSNTSSYEYLPEQAVTKAEYEEMSRNIKKVLEEDISREHIECEGGACPVDFREDKKDIVV